MQGFLLLFIPVLWETQMPPFEAIKIFHLLKSSQLWYWPKAGYDQSLSPLMLPLSAGQDLLHYQGSSDALPLHSIHYFDFWAIWQAVWVKTSFWSLPKSMRPPFMVSGLKIFIGGAPFAFEVPNEWLALSDIRMFSRFFILFFCYLHLFFPRNASVVEKVIASI